MIDYLTLDAPLPHAICKVLRDHTSVASATTINTNVQSYAVYLFATVLPKPNTKRENSACLQDRKIP